MYYRLNTSIVSDYQFDRWAYELANLQDQFPEIAAAAPFAAEFTGWDGTTGFDLPHNEWALRKAEQLLRYKGMNP
jgi:NAD-dependent DNA ligase